MVRADILSGNPVDVTTTFDNDASQTSALAVPGTTTGSSAFNDWMSATDSITITPGTPNGDQTRNIFQINFASTDNFSPQDTLAITVQLSPDQIFNSNFAALVIANDVQVPNGSISNGELSFELTNLDQIPGNGGEVQFIFDAESTTPEPGTLGLLALGGLAALIMQQKRARKFQRGSVR